MKLGGSAAEEADFGAGGRGRGPLLAASTGGYVATVAQLAELTADSEIAQRTDEGRAVTLSGAILRATEEWQSAARRPIPVAADSLIAFGTCRAFTSDSAAGWAALTFLVAGLTLGLWQSRLRLEVQGTLWYGRRSTGPIAAVAGALVLAGATLTRAVAAALCALAVLVICHAVMWAALGAHRRRSKATGRALLVGPAEEVRGVAGRLRVYPELGLDPAWLVDSESEFGPTGALLVDLLLERYRPDHVMCVVADRRSERTLKDFVAFTKGRAEISAVLPAARLGRRSSSTGCIGDLPYSSIRPGPSWGTEAAKRAFDLVGALALLVVLSPLLVLTALAIKFDQRGPVFFKQRRVGYQCRNFDIYKYRSMVPAADKDEPFLSREELGRLTFKIHSDPRVTRVGKLIRRLSIDELPQLWNVIRGDMSLVGPRPLAFHLDNYDDRGRQRFTVRPGITGLWQVSGANALDDEDMLDLDLSYAANHTLGMDVALLFRTIPAVLVRRAPV